MMSPMGEAHSERADVLALPSSGEVLADVRGNGRWMRVTWHDEADVVVLSLWKQMSCVGTLRLDRSDVPGLVNAGREHFKGAEFEAGLTLRPDLQLTGHYAWHDARFGDYLQLFGENPTQLRGRRLELSPQHQGGLGLVYAPAQGFQASIVATRIGERYLNKRNTALASGYSVFDASLGYRFDACELRINGRNLGDRRDPVAESELGEGQYYRLPGRWLELGLSCTR